MLTDKLKEIRESVKMNKKEFAEYLGIKYTTYNNYETGAREPASDFLILISNKFDVSIDYLLGQQKEKAVLHSYELKASEYEHIKKYRGLDDVGRKAVDYILEIETTRTQDLENAKLEIKKHTYAYNARIADYYNRGSMVAESQTYYGINAAHERTDIEVTDEMKKHDNDIMDDDSEWE